MNETKYSKKQIILILLGVVAIGGLFWWNSIPKNADSSSSKGNSITHIINNISSNLGNTTTSNSSNSSNSNPKVSSAVAKKSAAQIHQECESQGQGELILE